MANTIQGLIKIENQSTKNIETFVNGLKECTKPIWFKERDIYRYDFLTTCIGKDGLINLSKEENLEFTIIMYDTAMGWASKITFNNGETTVYKSILFGLDAESIIMENINYEEAHFFDALSNYIENNYIDEQ